MTLTQEGEVSAKIGARIVNNSVLAADLRQFDNDARFVNNNYPYLRFSFPDQWVAVYCYCHEIIGHHED